MKIVRLKPYLRAMDRMGLDDQAMRDIEFALAAAPEAHPVIKGLRGAGRRASPCAAAAKAAVAG